MVYIETSLRVFIDIEFHRAQEISRYPYFKFTVEPERVDDFIMLVSDNYSFADNLSYSIITTSTYKLYSNKITSK